MGQALRGSAEGRGGGRGTVAVWFAALVLLIAGVLGAQSDAPQRIDRGRFTAVFYPSEAKLAGALRARKVGNIESTRPDVVACGNVGCIAQIAAGTDLLVLHTVELMDWATGGPKPPALAVIRGGGARSAAAGTRR